jgi:hypothetical protein
MPFAWARTTQRGRTSRHCVADPAPERGASARTAAAARAASLCEHGGAGAQAVQERRGLRRQQHLRARAAVQKLKAAYDRSTNWNDKAVTRCVTFHSLSLRHFKYVSLRTATTISDE